MKFYCTKCSFETNSFWKALIHDIIHIYKVRKGERCESIDDFLGIREYRCQLRKGHSGIHRHRSHEWSNDNNN